MQANHLSLPALTALVTLGCQTPEPAGSLAQMKRTAQSRLAHQCIVDHSVMMPGAVNIDTSYMKMAIVRACWEYADHRIW
jgi:hypothetical protein